MSMSVRRRGEAGRPTRAHGDEGTAILEFTLVAVLLFTLIFGIINFGLILSFKQDMTRAAAEGARAGAVAYPAADAPADAYAAVDEAVKAFSGRFEAAGCQTEGIVGDCQVSIHDCGTTTTGNATIPDCVTVEIVYDYDSQPLLAALPMIEPFLPNEIRAKSDARINE